LYILICVKKSFSQKHASELVQGMSSLLLEFTNHIRPLTDFICWWFPLHSCYYSLKKFVFILWENVIRGMYVGPVKSGF